MYAKTALNKASFNKFWDKSFAPPSLQLRHRWDHLPTNSGHMQWSNPPSRATLSYQIWFAFGYWLAKTHMCFRLHQKPHRKYTKATPRLQVVLQKKRHRSTDQLESSWLILSRGWVKHTKSNHSPFDSLWFCKVIECNSEGKYCYIYDVGMPREWWQWAHVDSA